MATIDTMAPAGEIEAQVMELPMEVRSNTFCIRLIQTAIKNPDPTLAEKVHSAIQRRAWEIGVAVTSGGIVKVRQFPSWDALCKAPVDQGGLGCEPGRLFLIFTKELLTEDSPKAALDLVLQMDLQERLAYCRPVPGSRPSFLQICQGHQMATGNPAWAKVAGALQDANAHPVGAPEGNQNAVKNNPSDPLGLISADPTPSKKRSPGEVSNHSKEGHRRRWLKVINNPEATPEQVEAAVAARDVLDRNGTLNAARQAAGEDTEAARRIYISSDLAKVARNLHDALGNELTTQLIQQLQELL